MKRFCLFMYAMIWAGLSSLVISSAQTFQPLSPYGNITPSVETFTMTRYGSLVPSLYTGAMTFSVPVYTYSDPDFTIPVSLEYNYDGYKPSQHSGTVGLGWSLNCGGVITREIRGLPDEGSDSGSRLVGWKEARDSAVFYTTDRVMSMAQSSLAKPPLSFPTEHEMDMVLDSYDPSHDFPIYVKGNWERWYDTAPDLFHFDFCGYRGDFMMLKDGTVRVYNSNVPHGELSVKVYSVNETFFPTIEITTAQGYVYTFGYDYDSLETAHSRPVGEEHLRFIYGLGFVGQSVIPGGGLASSTLSALRLSQIEAPNGRRVRFSYDHRQWELFVNTDWFDKGNFRPLHEETVISNACSSPLQSVEISGGPRIEFGYEQKQYDEDAYAYFLSQYVWNSENFTGLNGKGSPYFDPKTYPRRLRHVVVRNATGELVDSLALTHVYASYGTPKMFLTSVSGLRSGTYSFDYYNLDNPAYPLPPQDHLGYDHWGYWNGKENTDVHLCLARDQNDYPETDLYSQMSSDQKAPNANYSLCGALKTITYPTGGTSAIEYEANMASDRIHDNHDYPSTPYTIGGLRVNRIVDRTGGDRSDTTSFLYSGGRLRQMPLHSFRQQISLSGTTSEDGGTTHNQYSKWTTSVSYSNKGMFSGPRDHFIGYEYVTQVHPDGSRTQTHFQIPGDVPGYGWSVSKDGLVYPLGISLSSYSPHYITIEPLEDRHNLRGLPGTRTVFDAAGKILSREELFYETELVTVDSLMFNEVAAFYIGPYSAAGAYPGGSRHTEYFYDGDGNGSGSLARTEHIDYNALGQKTSEQVISAADTVEVRYRYLQETGASSPSGLTRLLCDAVRLRHAGGRTYLIDAEHYDYGIADNPHPTRITRYDVGEGIDVTGLGDDALFASARSNPAVQYNFQYDDKFRLTKASFPGGAWISYTWDGNHIASKTENGASNQTLYSWRDLIGLTGMTAPSGQTESYEYDAHNRPWKTLDTDGNAVSVMHYHLQNDQ